jgi:radical SAM family uncharacterized protein
MAPVDNSLLDRWLPTVGKPARYTGHEWNAVPKSWSDASVRMVLAYPDTYEVGMSNLGLQILYDVINRHSDALCERAFAPWPDMEATMRAQGIPLYALESRRPLAEFDLIGFSLPYELNLTNVLNMLDLAGLAIRASERGPGTPIVIAGGSSAYHPEPMADFIDAFVVGEADEAILEVLDVLHRARQTSASKQDTLRELARVPGVYVPGFYQVTYTDQGTLEAIVPVVPEAQMPVVKRVVDTLPPAPTCLIVPYVQAVHDRGVIEIMRGCTQGCRFCQAGMIYRPLRERTRTEIAQTVREIARCTGYSEIGLISLSSADHSQIREIIQDVLNTSLPSEACADPNAGQGALSVTLPSLRTDTFSVELAQLFGRDEERNPSFGGGQVRRSGLTFAPEAGSQRLRDVINKKVTEQDLLDAAEAAYANQWQRVKLYFMIGLPTETDADVTAIVDLVRQVAQIGYSHHGRKANVSVTISTLVPKPHTPFQWQPLIDEQTLLHRQQILKEGLRARNVRLSYHDVRTSLLEAIVARGDRRLGTVIEHAWRAGARFDAWDEQLKWDAWLEAFAVAGVDWVAEPRRERDRDEVLPWDHVSCGVDKAYLWQEYERATQAEITRDCREGCTNCGAIESLNCRPARSRPTLSRPDKQGHHEPG